MTTEDDDRRGAPLRLARHARRHPSRMHRRCIALAARRSCSGPVNRGRRFDSDRGLSRLRLLTDQDLRLRISGWRFESARSHARTRIWAVIWDRIGFQVLSARFDSSTACDAASSSPGGGIGFMRRTCRVRFPSHTQRGGMFHGGELHLQCGCGRFDSGPLHANASVAKRKGTRLQSAQRGFDSRPMLESPLYVDVTRASEAR